MSSTWSTSISTGWIGPPDLSDLGATHGLRTMMTLARFARLASGVPARSVRLHFGLRYGLLRATNFLVMFAYQLWTAGLRPNSHVADCPNSRWPLNPHALF